MEDQYSSRFQVIRDAVAQIKEAARTIFSFVFQFAVQTQRSASQTTIGFVFKKLVLWGAVAVLGFSLLISLALSVYYPVPDYEPVSETHYLASQGWGASRESQERDTYYYTPQGTSIMKLRYKWFVALERPGSREPFTNPDHMRRYRFLVDLAPSKANPDLLPIGFARRYEPAVGEDVLDISCAVCHTGELHVERNGQRFALRIDGGQAMHAFTAATLGHFLPELIGSLTETYLNPLKYNRFARKVLGEQYPRGYFNLHGQVRRVLGDLLGQAVNDLRKGLYPVEEGFGRTDALARIGNNVFGNHLDPANEKIGNAPVSFPPVWDIWKFNWVQYSASVRQPMARNLGETLGTGASYDLLNSFGQPIPESDRYETSSMFANLVIIEETLKKLRPPKWPENLLGPIDCMMVKAGRQRFVQHCQPCHGPYNDEYMKKWEAPLKGPKDPHWRIEVKPVEVIGTDPTAAMNFVNNRYDLTKTGITAAQIRNLLLPDLAIDQKGYLWYLRAEIERIQKALPALKGDSRCWTLHDLDKKKSELEGTGSCEAVLKKLDAATSARDAACGSPGKPLVMFVEPACATALAAYKKSVREIAEEAAPVCPSIGAVLDRIDMRSVSEGAGLNYIGILMREKYYRATGFSDHVQAELNGYGQLDLPQVLPGYKPRPLAGIWATAPFLHNGSVPTLYELLSPVPASSERFPVGHRTFDPVNVGLVTRPSATEGFWLNTRLQGNRNTGHEFRAGYVEPCRIVTGAGGAEHADVQHQFGVIGPELSDYDKRAIIEYLKIHEDSPEGGDPECEFPSRCRVGSSKNCIAGRKP